MLTYRSDPQLKADFVAEVKRHADADQIVKGTYGEGIGTEWRGCAVGCAIHSYNQIRGGDFNVFDHGAIEAIGLWPEWLARLGDTMFEALPVGTAVKWPLRLAEAIPVGVDLEPVKWSFCAFLMHDNIDRVAGLDIPEGLKEQVTEAIRGVLQLHELAIITGEWNESAAESARSAARSAARSVAWSATSAAWSAAESAASAAWSVARSAESAASAASVAWSAARSAESAAYERHADKLIALLEGAAA